MPLFHKIIKLALFILMIALSILFAISIYEQLHPSAYQIKYGLTFSPKYARELNLDWRDVYLDVLYNLNVKNLRLPTYWDVIEENFDKYDFNQTDFMIDEASKKGVEVILVLGERQPRWPECHIPSWAKALEPKDRREKLLLFIKKVVEKYKDNQEISAWQVENEPFLDSFGQGCDKYTKDLLEEEIDLVKSLSNKQIILTDSGELGDWVTPLELSDIFGTTLYRDVQSPIFGYATYPLPPYFYQIKANLIKNLLGQKNKLVFISELQAEPWSEGNNLAQSPLDIQIKHLSLQKFKDNIEYAQNVGFDEIYLWGVEWWYFMEKMGHPEYLEYAKSIFK